MVSDNYRTAGAFVVCLWAIKKRFQTRKLFPDLETWKQEVKDCPSVHKTVNWIITTAMSGTKKEWSARVRKLGYRKLPLRLSNRLVIYAACRVQHLLEMQLIAMLYFLREKREDCYLGVKWKNRVNIPVRTFQVQFPASRQQRILKEVLKTSELLGR